MGRFIPRLHDFLERRCGRHGPCRRATDAARHDHPLLNEQPGSTLLGGGTAAALADTSKFLKEQKRLDTLLPDYRPTVTAAYVQQAIKQ